MTEQTARSPEATNPSLAAVDPRIAELIAQEARRQATKLQLIPSENYASRAVMQACGSVLTNQYSEGYPGRRYYEGQQVIDQVELLAIQRAKELFGVEHANVQPYSGSPANLAIYLAYCQPGDTVMGMALPMGGHLTHGWNVSVTGKWFQAVQYGVRRDTGIVDLDEVRDLARRERPKLIFCGGTAIPRTIDFAGFAEIAGEVGAILVADIAHVAGLVIGGVHPPRWAMRRSSRPRPTRRCEDRAAPCCCAAASTPRRWTGRSFRGCRAARTTTPSRGSRWRCTRPRSQSSATTPRRSSPTPSGWARCSQSVASIWCPVAPTTTCC